MIDPTDLYNAPITDYIVPIIDARSIEEFNLSHIPTALCASQYETLDLLNDQMLDMGFENRYEVVIYGNGTDDERLKKLADYFNIDDKYIVRILKGGIDVFAKLFPGIVLPSFDDSHTILPAYIPVANMYLGSVISANVETLQALGVTSIVNAGVPSCPQKAELAHTFNYLLLDLEDTPTQSLQPHLGLALDFIKAHAAQGPVFVHCAQGISRSASIVVAALMLQQGMSYAEAMDLVKRCRRIARPNTGFCEQLEALEKKQ